MLELKALVGSFAPKVLATSFDDSFTIKWVDDDEYAKREAAPYGTFRLGNPVPGRTVKNYRKDYRLLSDTDIFTFAEAQTDYQVQFRDIDAITSVNGIVGGSPHTFVDNIDYKDASSPNYNLSKDVVRWLEDGTHPDEGTDFTVVYDYPVIDMFYAKYSMIPVRLILHVGDHQGIGLIVRKYAKTRLGQQLYESLVGYLTANQGKELSGTAGAFVMNGVHEVNILRTDKAESLSRWVVDVQFNRRQLVFKETVPRIGSAIPTVSTP